MAETAIRKKVYQKYILQWMIDHNHTIDEMIDILAEMNTESDEPTCVSELFETFVNEQGFDLEIWACFDEFLENEYLDTTYILSFLHDPQDRSDYTKDILALKRGE